MLNEKVHALVFYELLKHQLMFTVSNHASLPETS